MLSTKHAVVFAFATASVALAGPLNPPLGAISSTAKPLAEIEPRTAINAQNTPGDADSTFRITQPGSYYLTGNVNGAAAMKGIEVAASNVTIDLRGFTITGVPGSLNGISAETVTNVSVTNGTVAGWGGIGIVIGSYGRVTGVTARSNGPIGIYADQSSVVEACVSEANADIGIYANAGSTITNCTARNNTGYGFSLNSCAITNCVARINTGGGMFVQFDSTVAHCVSSSNGGDGLAVGTSLFHTTVITDSSFCHNDDDGIQVSSRTFVRGCTCCGNGEATATGAGIRVTSSDARIEGNHCVGNDRGVAVVGTGSVIVRNTCSGNTINWEIAANNVYGPIVDRSAPASAAVSGNAAASAMGTSDPSANITN